MSGRDGSTVGQTHPPDLPPFSLILPGADGVPFLAVIGKKGMY